MLGPISRANHAFSEDLGDDWPIGLVVERIVVVPLCAPSAFQLEVGRDSHREEAVGPFHK